VCVCVCVKVIPSTAAAVKKTSFDNETSFDNKTGMKHKNGSRSKCFFAIMVSKIGKKMGPIAR